MYTQLAWATKMIYAGNVQTLDKDLTHRRGSLSSPVYIV